MAEIEEICARLCLLTREVWHKGLPAPMPRGMVRRMLQKGAITALTLRQVEGIPEECYLRAEALLSRSAQMCQAVEKMRAQGYDVLLPEDEEWPTRLYALGAQMPQFLFVRGNRGLFRRRCVAVAGSRAIEPGTKLLARECGARLAREGNVMVSGGAKGVDTEAHCGLFEEGGSLILVPAMPVQRLLGQDELRRALKENRLLIVCDTWPEEHFSAPKALMRNHTIYALGDAAIAVASRKKRGGTWDGAMACLRGRYTPVYAADEIGPDFCGNLHLLSQGAGLVCLRKPLGDQLFAKGELICR